jgi:prevent-host-death family protein
MIKTSVADAKAKLSEYLERAQRGERFVICRHNRPVAELGPVAVSRTEPRPLGRLEGRPAFTVDAAFFEPLPEAELDAWDGVERPMGTAGPPVGARAWRVAEKKASFGAPRTARRRKPRRRS